GELLVVQVDGSLVLRVEIADPAGGVAIGADVLHGNAAALPIIKLDGNGRAQRDADAVANVVRDALIRSGRHVAGGAGGRGGIVLADNPGFGVEIHLGDVGAVLNAVLGLIVNLDLRMIGAEVAFTAIFRLPRQRGAEGMPSVARGAGAFAAVGIHAADAAVGPGGRIEAAVAEILHFASMALAASVVRRGSPFHNFAKHVVQRADELRGGGVVTLFKLLDFSGVAARAIVGRHDHGYLVAVMLERGGVLGVRLVAGVAIDALFGVCAGLPLLHDPGSRRGVAFDAGLAGFGGLRRLRVEERGRRKNQEDGKKTDSHEASMKKFQLGRNTEADCISVRSAGGGV